MEVYLTNIYNIYYNLIKSLINNKFNNVKFYFIIENFKKGKVLLKIFIILKR